LINVSLRAVGIQRFPRATDGMVFLRPTGGAIQVMLIIAISVQSNAIFGRVYRA